MLRRKVYDRLLEWKGRKNHKCLLIKGQKQVGKTFIVDEFGKSYGHFVKIDLHEDADIRAVFRGDMSVDAIIKGLSVYRDPGDFVPGSTLLFFDEIQDCPEARSSLKQFTVDGRYDVIAS